MIRSLTVALAATVGLLLAPPVVAQDGGRPAYPAPNFARPDAARACVAAHLSSTARQPSTTVSHRRLMDRYDVKYYKLDLALENDSRNIAGSVTLKVQVGSRALDSLAFELYQAPAGSPAGTATLLIDSVVVNGRKLFGIVRVGPDATAFLGQPAAANALLTARIYYHGTAPNGNSAAIGNAFSTATQYYMNGGYHPYNVTWSLSEPFSAHEWFPCKQVLTDKADSSDVWVTTTLPNKVGSNGVLARTVLLPGNKVRYEWKSRHPIDYYLISVAVAPYVETTTYANPVGGPRIPIVDYVYDQGAVAYYQTEINRTAGFIENYSTLFGLYPFANEKYGHSTAPIGGGMEHQTMTTQDGYTFTLTAHELCHQWWGDNVTCGSWEDIWLNEAFASYGEYLSLQALGTPADARAWIDQAGYYAQNRYNGGWVPDNTGSVYVADTTNTNRIFNYYLTYKKGAFVLHMMRYLFNDDVRYFRALRAYQTQFRNRTARTADLQRVLEAELGRPLGYFFQQWFRGQGYPAFNVRWNQVGNTVQMRVTETASNAAVTPFFDTDVPYKLVFSNGTSSTVRLHQGQAISQFTVPANGLTVASIVVDPDQWVLDLPGTVVQDNTLALGSRAVAATTALRVSPNPCTSQLLLTELPVGTAQADILDATGRLVRRQPLSAAMAQLDTQALAPGMYFLRALDAAGQPVGQARFVRE